MDNGEMRAAETIGAAMQAQEAANAVILPGPGSSSFLVCDRTNCRRTTEYPEDVRSPGIVSLVRKNVRTVAGRSKKIERVEMKTGLRICCACRADKRAMSRMAEELARLFVQFVKEHKTGEIHTRNGKQEFALQWYEPDAMQIPEPPPGTTLEITVEKPGSQTRHAGLTIHGAPKKQDRM